MESINLGAVLFALLLVLWVAYAIPQLAQRRDVMGRARAAERTEVSATARDLSAAIRSRRPSREVSAPVPQDRLLLRPADPTRRPRFDATPGERIDHLEERARHRRLLAVVLVSLLLATAAVGVLAFTQMLPVWSPAVPAAVLAVYLVGLRRAELERRARSQRAAAIAKQEARAREEALRIRDEAPVAASRPAARLPERDTLEGTTERAARHVAAPGEWTPRPVPRPTYTMRGEVDDLATRHAAHREYVRATTVPLERGDVELLEATDEQAAPAVDLHLDEVLARRRA
ncbi:hypothetical protein M4D54_02080 [Brachybacterium sp. p3-SID1565]|uniref:hypothetical protein n=1 Tax=Brachybacterium sp. p3-SID1565 TaxID=2916046 RepID=UPI0021A79D4E|nr:hypothetical protein [Brachybacterium sp. p3-SID1565]MCT1384428.1 hypothetical protein [Brachybacterium sp. p3-SID1565]